MATLTIFILMMFLLDPLSCQNETKKDGALSRLESYKKAFVAKRLMQKSIVQKLASYTDQDYKKRDSMMRTVYETMAKVLAKSLKVLKDNNFDEKSPFPEENNYDLDESLSLVYENCLLYSDVHLRYPEITEQIFMTKSMASFKSIISEALFFCSKRDDLFDESTDYYRLVNLTLQDMGLIQREENFTNPYRKKVKDPKLTAPVQPKAKKEKKKLQRGPFLSKNKEL